jgi:hypothetical protein
LNLFFNCIPHHFISFQFYVKFGLYFFNCYLFCFRCFFIETFFFQFYPLIFCWLGFCLSKIWLHDFLRLAFYRIILALGPESRAWKVSSGWLRFFFHNWFFSIPSFYKVILISYVGLWVSQIHPGLPGPILFCLIYLLLLPIFLSYY